MSQYLQNVADRAEAMQDCSPIPIPARELVVTAARQDRESHD